LVRVYAYNVCASDVEALAKDVLVKEFLGQYKGRVLVGYGHILCMFFKWLRMVKDLDFGPSAFVNEHARMRASANVEDRRWVLRLVLEFARDNPDFAELGGSRKGLMFTVLKSFFGYHEADLTNGRGVFGKKGPRKYRVKQMSLDVARKVLGCLPQRERAVCLVQLQSGMGIGDVLAKFNFQYDYVRECLRKGATRIKVEFDERKHNGFSYFTYISVDAIQELRKWMAEREKISERFHGKVADAIFIKYHNGGAYDIDDFEQIYSSWIRKARLKDGPWSFSSHMFRKLFKTESRPPERNVDQDCVEFMMGHLSGIESVGGIYDRTPELYEGVIEKEYAKLEPYVNIYSGKPAAEARGLQLTEERMKTLELIAQKFEEGKIKIKP